MKRFLLKLIPDHWRRAIGTYRVLAKHGHVRSARQLECVDASGAPIPWYTYPATAYLAQLDWRDRAVFEYGSGNSTIWWSGRAKSVAAVESDPAWFDKISARVSGVRLSQSEREYIEGCRPADVIIIDGDHRRACAEFARPLLRPGGLMILDNADWHPNTSAFLRESGLIEVDFTGLGPINPYAWTTSLFLSRDFGVRPNAGQPVPGIGAVMHRCD